VHSVEKANVMESGVFWRQVATRVHEDYKHIELHHMYADNCAMQLVRYPKQFDVIVTDNLFGDILSDCAAMLTGSLGMLPSASLGEADESGRRRAMYEPVHGSAPDIAGEDKANPLATILSYAMCLRYSFDMGEDADMIEKAVENVLAFHVQQGLTSHAPSVKDTLSIYNWACEHGVVGMLIHNYRGGTQLYQLNPFLSHNISDQIFYFLFTKTRSRYQRTYHCQTHQS